ncbi:hypothetical protein SMKI_04G7160 [Saccharomyces mikatae IFO 1815]|uniref:Uncharacterized protein n=1 Tax=Saccharomyces mikatae IFO 1815 TaxID=226126 RepID=A0AA35NF35_SACMI|nr:uncharacterized protein SMKI_04G7160 [Saccharomyces mikatae IFO 1815]CAI4038372.1 hypothetical protein SMKI_04G7160 [Saccharomyces mikatae IFO 1815]
MIFFCFLFPNSKNGYSACKRKGVARIGSVSEINFGVLRPEATKAANHVRRRGRTVSREVVFWNCKRPNIGPRPSSRLIRKPRYFFGTNSLGRKQVQIRVA